MTYEILPAKAALAHETIHGACIDAWVRLVEGDARDFFDQHGPLSFCFPDAEKEVYQECAAGVLPKLVPGGWLIADNLLSHQDELAPFREMLMGDPRVAAMVLPLGKGLLLARKVG